MRVVTNSGPLVALAKLGHLELLKKIFGKVLIPHEVHKEVVVNGCERSLPDARFVKQAVHFGWLEICEQQIIDPAISQLPLHWGEKAVLSLSFHSDATLLLMDDLLARKHAVSFGFCVKGTLGILVNAYRSQLINDKELDGIFHVIEKRSDIWLSKKLCRQVLQKLYSDESKK